MLRLVNNFLSYSHNFLKKKCQNYLFNLIYRILRNLEVDYRFITFKNLY